MIVKWLSIWKCGTECDCKARMQYDCWVQLDLLSQHNLQMQIDLLSQHNLQIECAERNADRSAESAQLADRSAEQNADRSTESAQLADRNAEQNTDHTTCTSKCRSICWTYRSNCRTIDRYADHIYFAYHILFWHYSGTPLAIPNPWNADTLFLRTVCSGTELSP